MVVVAEGAALPCGWRSGAGGSPAGRKPGEPGTDDAKWLKYSHQQAAAEGGKSGYVDWHPFKHPQLGDVEVGGFLPLFKDNPPESEARGVWPMSRRSSSSCSWTNSRGSTPIRRWSRSLAQECGGSPSALSTTDFSPRPPRSRTRPGPGLPTLVTMGLPIERLISGEKHSRAWVIPGSGGRFETQWILRGEDGEKIEVNVRPNIGPARVLTIELQEASR